jgi:hypothetical protein
MLSVVHARNKPGKISVNFAQYLPSASTSGTGGSNPSRSATESRLFGFSARSGGIARACGFICVMRGTGEKHFPPVRARDAAKVSVGK